VTDSQAAIAPRALEQAALPNTPNATPAPSAKGARGTAKSAPNAAVPAATLAQEGQLLRQGLAAERQGRFTDAASALTQLVEKFPNSPLLPDARAALTRVRSSAQR
jgi:TolA-binding protein